FGRAVATTAVISFDYLTTLRNSMGQRTERLQDLCCSNRGTFIKVGQHLGALDYPLPEGYTSTMKVLHSRAPKSSMEEIRPVIREDLGKELSDLFIQFEKKPQGAASLAQVQKVVLPDGRTVAVKVQHPKVQHKSSKNIVVMEFLLQVVHWLFPDFSFMWLVEETKKNMPLELDFLNEGRNAEKIADMLKQFKFLKIPKIHWDLSTKRILTMDYAEGGQVNDRKYMRRNGININKISWNLGKIYSEMIFKCPESNKTEIVLLDHDFRLDYCRLWQSLIKGDLKGIKRYSRRLGTGDLYPLFACVLKTRTWKSVNVGIIQTPVTQSEDVEIRTNVALYLPQISELLNRIPRQMLLPLKTNNLLRGIETILQTRASSSSFINISRCCTRAIARHKRSKIKSRTRRLQISLSQYWSLCQIDLFELMMWLRSSTLARWVCYLLNFLPYSN
uniref:AarF domain-containing protein kinase 1 n=1 Tax=Cyprinus carpio TaxID=7962 RepID=A0A8C2AH15_CYPCA